MIRLLLVFLSLGTCLSAHVVEQLYGEFHLADSEWEIDFTFDIGLAEDGGLDPDKPQPSRESLFVLTETEHGQLRERTAKLLRQGLDLSGDYEISFPDYDDSPASFPKLLNGGAYLQVVLRGELPGEGDLTLTHRSPKLPQLVLKIDERLRAIWEGDTEVIHAGNSSAQSVPGFDFWDFLRVGFVHVLPDGWDHVLFVVGLCLVQLRLRPVLWQSLAFTVAHSLTLALAGVGWLPAGGRWIEILIAASIAVMGFAAWRQKGVSRGHLGLVFGFGLVHGMGFAGALADPLRESTSFLSALATMNLGVELAQVVVILLVFLLFRISGRKIWLIRAGSLLVMGSGIYLTVTRLW